MVEFDPGQVIGVSRDGDVKPAIVMDGSKDGGGFLMVDIDGIIRAIDLDEIQRVLPGLAEMLKEGVGKK